MIASCEEIAKLSLFQFYPQPDEKGCIVLIMVSGYSLYIHDDLAFIFPAFFTTVKNGWVKSLPIRAFSKLLRSQLQEGINYQYYDDGWSFTPVRNSCAFEPFVAIDKLGRLNKGPSLGARSARFCSLHLPASLGLAHSLAV